MRVQESVSCTSFMTLSASLGTSLYMPSFPYKKYITIAVCSVWTTNSYFRANNYWTCTQHIQGYFSVKCWPSMSAELHQQTRGESSLCKSHEAGSQVHLCRDASGLFQFRRVCYCFFTRLYPERKKKKVLCTCDKEDTILKFLTLLDYSSVQRPMRNTEHEDTFLNRNFFL